MILGLGSVGFGLLAGLVSTLSPCVLPLLPLVIGAAAASHRYGPLALASGVVLSFVAIGLFVATVGFSLGLDGDFFRVCSALMLGAVGVLLLSATLQQRMATSVGGLGNAANSLLSRVSPTGLQGQLLVGLLLGAAWSPCVGPTLGAASVAAAQREDLFGVAAVMASFGIGAAIPLLLVGSLSREALLRWRGRLMTAGSTGKALLGMGALLVAAIILTGVDHRLEAVLVGASPDWLTNLTTRF